MKLIPLFLPFVETVKKVGVIVLMALPWPCNTCKGTNAIVYDDPRLYKKLGDIRFASWNTSGRLKRTH